MAPDHINAYLLHTDILKAVGIPVKATLPTVTTCPFCQFNSLHVYADARGGAWYYCRGCDFSGDSIELYAKRHSITLKTAIKQLFALKLFTKPVLTPSSADAYAVCAGKRKRLKEFWKSCRLAIRPRSPMPDCLPLIQKFGLSLEWNIRWYREMGKFVGASNRRALSQLIRGASVPARNFMVFPHQDMPGRICSAVLMSVGKSTRVYMHDQFSKVQEDGLYMLESTAPGLPTVYALGDPLMAMYLQRKHLLDSSTPLPIVAWDTCTNTAWDALHAKRIILWDNGLTPRLFEQARRVNGLIAMQPSLGSITAYEYVRRQFGSSSITTVMEHSALPWQTVFKNWILTSHPIDVAEALTSLALTAGEKQQLLGFCLSQAECDKVSEYLGSPNIAASIVYDGMVITERNGQWIMRKVQGGIDTLLSDAIIRLHKVLRYEADNKNYFSGVIEYQGKTIPFTDETSYVEKHTHTWLTNKVLDAGFARPRTNEVWTRKLINVAQSFEEPQTVLVSERVGLDGDSFNFPRFTISSSGMMPKPEFGAAQDVEPAADLEMPQRFTDSEIRTLLNSAVHGPAEFWAVMACIAANALAVQFDTARTCIGLVGRGAVLAGRLASDAYSLLKVNLVNKRWKSYITDKCKHDLPVLLHHEPRHGIWRRVVGWRENGGHSNIIAPLTAPAAACLSVTDNWVFVVGQEDLDDLPGPEACRKLLPLYIAHMQSLAYELPGELLIWYSILDTMRTWIHDLYPEYGDPAPVFERAKTCVREGSPDNVSAQYLRLIDFIIYLGRTKELGFGHAGYDTEQAVMLDDDAGRVRIDVEKVTAIDEKLGAPRWDWPSLVDSMQKAGALSDVDMRLGNIAAIYIAKPIFDARHDRFVDQSVLRESVEE